MNDTKFYHAAVGERNNHKYVARVPISGSGGKKFRYFYTQAEYQEYLRGDKKAQSVNAGNKKAAKKDVKTSKSASAKDALSKGKSFLEKLFKGSKKPTSKDVKSGKDFVDKVLSDAKKAIDKTVKDTKKNIEEAKKKTSVKIEKSVEKSVDKATEKATKAANKTVDNITKIVNDIYDDEDNMYDVKSQNYDKKIKQIANSKEWQAIVRSKDPEYVRKNKETGQTEYLIDDYLAKKKMPLLDIIDDISNCRPITVNKIEKDALMAGLKQQLFGKATLGMMAVGAAGKFFLEKSKLTQGSYDDEVDNAKQMIEDGAKEVNRMLNNGSSASANMTDIAANLIANSGKVADTLDSAGTINEDDVMEAAKILMQTSGATDTKTYAKAEAVLSNLTEEEIVMLNLLLNSIH
jgi:uncharacterized protein YqfB (UPF0267 family)